MARVHLRVQDVFLEHCKFYTCFSGEKNMKKIYVINLYVSSLNLLSLNFKLKYVMFSVSPLGLRYVYN